jgi:hypothetical protein
VPIDIDPLAAGCGKQDGQQPGRRINALKLAQKLAQRRRLIRVANQGGHRMLLGSEFTEPLDAN